MTEVLHGVGAAILFSTETRKPNLQIKGTLKGGGSRLGFATG